MAYWGPLSAPTIPKRVEHDRAKNKEEQENSALGVDSSGTLFTTDLRAMRSIMGMGMEMGTDASNKILQQQKYDTQLEVLFIGDSTMRHQYYALCDILEAPVLEQQEATAIHCQSPPSASPIWGFSSVKVAYLERPRGIKMARSLPVEISNSISGNSSNRHPPRSMHITYFATSALHLLQLGSARAFANEDAARDLEKDVGAATALIRIKNSCPVFQMMHYVCDEKFTGQWASVINSPDYLSNNAKYCKENSKNASLCLDFSFTSLGSKRLHARESAAIQRMKSPPAVVDAFSITDGQCWATKSGDGRHYIPLIPVELQILSYHIKDCIVAAGVVPPTTF